MIDKKLGKGCITTKCKYITLLMLMTVTLYLSIELCLFTSDQYVFYNAVTEQGLPYLTRQERHKYANLSADDKIKLTAAQKKAATLESTTNAVRITLGLISMLIVGYISDRHGRRVALGILFIGEFLHITTMSLIVTNNLNVWLLLLAGFFEAFFGGGLLSIYSQVAAIVVDIMRISHAKKAERGQTVTAEKINHDTWIWFTVFESIALLCSSSGGPIGGLYTQLVYISQNVKFLCLFNISNLFSLRGISDFISSVVGVTYIIIVVKIRERKSMKQKSVTNDNHISQQECINDKSRKVFLRNMRMMIFTLAVTLLLMTINKIMMGLAHQFTQETASTIAYMAAIPRLSKSFITPIARSMFSLCTPPDNQGMIQSFGGFVARIGFVITFTTLPALYAATVTIFPPTVFFVVSGILVLTIIVDL
ncbi:hypothetical protein Smp_168990 [Schistosoma mansoni]|uniref:hypothetical protein n=1 Tax=Schistosoma mansoni TaxID=6183 RepID=UPI00019B387D|nr:hypothetical protein Smp_168990 [Schistosoma mansoni]|eukprot:XP_018654832.1 hypothetical protein Smp_168990 [Schistosoma mansoni]